MATDPLTPENVRVGATIRALREAHELSQPELARAIGVSQPLISLIESGERRATMANCRAIADVLGVSHAAISGSPAEQVKAIADKLGVTVEIAVPQPETAR